MKNTIWQYGRQYGGAAALALGVALFGTAATVTPAQAQPYLGWDFGSGVGVGIGTPPSAYTPCPDYGWLPRRCAYPRAYPRYYRHARHHHRHRQHS